MEEVEVEEEVDESELLSKSASAILPLKETLLCALL